VGTGDVGRAAATASVKDPFASFREAGRALHSLGLVRGTEGNLSTFDGRRLLITRTGAALSDLQRSDLVEGTLNAPPPGASSDLPIHQDMFRGRGPGAVVHAHPAGTVPERWEEGEPHGRYAFALSLDEAVAAIVRGARAEGLGP
jgi:hypothetical protein